MSNKVRSCRRREKCAMSKNRTSQIVVGLGGPGDTTRYCTYCYDTYVRSLTIAYIRNIFWSDARILYVSINGGSISSRKDKSGWTGVNFFEWRQFIDRYVLYHIWIFFCEKKNHGAYAGLRVWDDSKANQPFLFLNRDYPYHWTCWSNHGMDFLLWLVVFARKC